MKKVFKRLHLWLAIPSGVFITLICLTGAIMVFQTQIEETLYPKRYFNWSGSGVMPLDELVEKANEQLTADTITTLKVYSDSKRNIVATLSSGARVYAYINPSTAKVVEVKNARVGFFHEVMTLHRWLMLSDRATGRLIIGVSTIFMIMILITGFIRWFPRRWSNLNNYWFKWRGINNFRKTLDLHKILGAYSALLLLVMALTGLMWSFDWYRSAVAKTLNVEISEKRSNKPSISRKTNDVQLFWQSAFDQITAINTDYNFVSITKSGDLSFLPLTARHTRASDKYEFNFKDGTVVFVSKYANGSSSHMMSENYAIHIGSWGGVVTQIMWFLAALIGASLPISGYILLLSSKNIKRGM